MDNYQNILQKLRRFSKRYYTQKLVKGILLFIALGLLFFLVIAGLEYFLWLNSTGRLILFLVFITAEGFLLYTYVITPLFYLSELKKGISNKQASRLIGAHFSEVDDKLYNLLELAEDPKKSELLIASIEQRSKRLRPVPFVKAINPKESLLYIKYLTIPAALIAIIWLSGNLRSFFGSYNRVVNYDVAFEPPAPFSFKLLNSELNALETETLTLQVITEGAVKPDDVFMVIDDKEILLQKQGEVYEFTLTPPWHSTNLYFKANGVRSRAYAINALKVPAIKDFKLLLEYPSYTNKPDEVLKSTGNATFPEGTRVRWEIKAQNTQALSLITADTTLTFRRAEEEFKLSKKVYRNLEYQLSTSNENVRDFEKLDYRFRVIKDAFPRIKVEQVIDSLNPNVSYYQGEVSDDYEVRKVQLVYYPENNKEAEQVLDLVAPRANFGTFYYTFPSGLQLQEGVHYKFYFQTTDNDAVNGGKTTKSQVFGQAILDDNQLKNKQLDFQQSLLKKIDNSLDGFKEQKKALEELNRENKEKKSLSFNDQKRLKDFLKQQKQQEQLMEKFNRQLKENLEKTPSDGQQDELLKERLERQELEAKKNEKLLEELSKIADKIDKEELSKKLEELGKSQQNNERSLEQLVELTKRYYVTEKAAQLAKDLEKLAEKQQLLSELKLGEEFSAKEQEKLNKAFEELAKELEQLQKDNQELKKPMDLNVDREKEAGVKQDQQQALEEINKHQGEEQSSSGESKEKMAKTASKKQQSAAQKMKEMSDELRQSTSMGGGSTIAEDAEMLRQILDNLVTFSFKQEKLYDALEGAELDISHFSGTVRQQQELRTLFEHVDDSLFALSLRRAEISEFVNEQITEVYYNIDKSLETIAEGQVYQGVSYQQYVLTASNNLADFLANLLDNMQQSMQPGQGSGQGQNFQLPDIIKSQGELQEQMGEMGKSGKQNSEGQQGKGEQEGEGEEKGNEDGSGAQGGQKGEQEGSEGKDGKGPEGGEEGAEGAEGGPSEEELKEIYEIYKEQQQLRNLLEKQLEDMIEKKDKDLTKRLLRQMEDFENDLLENGVTERTLAKINNIQHQLLKLENAALKQGEKQERESNTNQDIFRNPITTQPELLRKKADQIEILNRQALPLQQIYRDKVRRYFGKDD